MLLAVKTGAFATPCALVTAVFIPPANVPLAPLAGAVKATVTPLIGLPAASFTVACSCVANAVLMVALWGVPAVAVMLGPVPVPPLADLNAAKAAPQLLDTPKAARAEAVPAAAWIWSSAISFVFGSTGTLSSIM